jgi:integrase
MSRVNFTDRFLSAFKAPQTGRTTAHDSTVRGLGVLAQSTGTKSFFWARRCNGKLIYHTLGSCSDVTLEQARARASEINAAVAKWKEGGYIGPFPVGAPRDKLTVAGVFDDYCSLYVMKKAKRPDKAVESARWQFESYLSQLSSKQLASVTRAEVRDLHAMLTDKHGKVTANRNVQLLRRVINWAIRTDRFTGENPATKIELHHEQKRKRFLQPAELPHLFAALKEDPSDDLRDFVKLALWTGARKSDILSMRWQDVSLADNRWRVPETTKTGESYDIALTPEAVEILTERRAERKNSPWVFPSRGVTGHLVDLKGAWKKLLERAKIVNLTQHDLRRTLGSYQAAQGSSLQVIGKSLGHRDLAATQIYSQLDLDPVRESVMAATRAMIVASKTPKRKLLEASHEKA